MELTEKKKKAIKVSIISLVIAFIGDYGEPISRALDFLLSFF